MQREFADIQHMGTLSVKKGGNIVLALIVIITMLLVSCGTPENSSADAEGPDTGVEATDAGIEDEEEPGDDGPVGGDASISEPIEVVVTTFPIYDWVSNIASGMDGNIPINLTFLMDNGVDMHSYQPSAEDILKIKTCDLFIFVGGESDEWIYDVFKNMDVADTSEGNSAPGAGSGPMVINLIEALGNRALEEEIIEGMEDASDVNEGAEADVDDEAGADTVDEAGRDMDEHVWLSLRNAEYFCNIIADALAEIDPGNGEFYGENATTYIEKLKALDEEYLEALSHIPMTEDRPLVFADRFPFRYLVEDYGLSYYAAFSGCSAETEASFETVAFLTEKVNEYRIKNLLIIDGSEGKLAETIKENSDDKDMGILIMNSMQSMGISKEKPTERNSEYDSYIDIMRENLEVLKEALG